MSSHKIEVKVDNHLPSINGDRLQLREVLVNLIDNAAEYSVDTQKIL